jgi:hypothetical protein
LQQEMAGLVAITVVLNKRATGRHQSWQVLPISIRRVPAQNGYEQFGLPVSSGPDMLANGPQPHHISGKLGGPTGLPNNQKGFPTYE